jgi:hypothetical protein
MNKPKIGQTLYSLNVGNDARNCEQKLTPVVVTSVGKKYFYTGEDYRKEAYLLDTWRQKTNGYSATSILFETEQDYKDEVEGGEICKHISKAFEYGHNRNGVSLNDLRAVQTILARSLV